MPISFSRLGILFKLFGKGFYPINARKQLSGFVSPLAPGEVVMDLGGGTGALIELAHGKRTDLRYVCVDPAVGMLRYTPSYACRVAGRAEELPFKKGIAAIMIGDALHHFRSPEKAIEEAGRALKEGGRLFVFDINPRTFMGRGVVAMEKLFREPAEFFSPEQLGDLLAGKGFVVVSVTGRSRYTIEAILP